MQEPGPGAVLQSLHLGRPAKDVGELQHLPRQHGERAHETHSGRIHPGQKRGNRISTGTQLECFAP